MFHEKVRVGLIGYGKAGQAVARVFKQDSRFELTWITKQSEFSPEDLSNSDTPLISLNEITIEDLFKKSPVDALVDFSSKSGLYKYSDIVSKYNLTLVTAISCYEEADINHLKDLGKKTRVLASPNITLGINFLLTASKLLRSIAPFADIAIIEQHFKEKPEVSGTAQVIAQNLDIEKDEIKSLRLGGIVGQHEVIFGFPHQTVRLTHESIRREAFGTGALFALTELMNYPNGFYTFEDLLERKIRNELLGSMSKV